jgi:hypothetical protein
MTRKKIFNYTNDQVNEVIDLIEKGEMTLTSACLRKDMDYLATRRALDELGYILPRKRNKVNAEVRQQIDALFSKGCHNTEIAKMLDLSVPTVVRYTPAEKRDKVKKAPMYVRFTKRDVNGIKASMVLGISYNDFVKQAIAHYANSILAR